MDLNLVRAALRNVSGKIQLKMGVLAPKKLISFSYYVEVLT